jgi:hypothetical protein
VTSPLVAGGTGAVTVTVSNTGDVDGTIGPVTLVAPEGLAIADVTPQDCARSCTVPAQGSTTVDVALTVDASLPASVPLQLDLGPLTTPAGSVDVAAGIEQVEISSAGQPADPLIADGQEATRSVAVISSLTTPGPVTLTAPKGVTLAACGKAGASVTCPAPFDLGITVPIGYAPGSLALSAVDAGQRPLKVTELTVAAPAALTLDVPESATALAGGPGTLTVTVTNRGGSPSAGQESLTAALPEGFTLTGSTCDEPAAAALAVAVPTAAAGPCALPVLAVDEKVAVTFSFTAPPQAGPTQSIDVRLDGQEPVTVPLTVGAGITRLAADPDLALPANDTAQPVTLVATPAADGLILGSVTLSSAEKDVQVTCASDCRVGPDRTVAVIITVASTHASEPLRLLAQDAGGRPIEVDPIAVLGAPQVSLTGPTVVRSPIAGGQGQFSLTVTNRGESPLPAGQPIGITAPGFTVVSVEGAGVSQCDKTGCRLPQLDAASSITITITLAAPADTKPGTYQLTADLLDRSYPVDFTVGQAITGLVATPGGPLTAGTTTTLSIAATLAGEPTDPIAVTLTSTSPLVTLSGCKGNGSSMTCTGQSFTVAVTIDAKQPAGPLPVTATDAAGNAVALTDGAAPLQVVAPATTLALSELTVIRDGSAITTLSLRVTNPTTATIPARSIALTYPSPPVAGHLVEIVGPGRIPVYCVTSCAVPSLKAGQHSDLTIYLLLPRPTTDPVTVSVTIDGITRTATVIDQVDGLTRTDQPAGPATPDAATDGAAPSTDPTPNPTPSSEPTPVPAEPTGPAESTSAAPATDGPSTDRPTRSSTETGATDGERPTTASPTTESPSTESPSTASSTSESPTTASTTTSTTAESPADTGTSTPEPAPAHLSLGTPAVLDPLTAGGSGRLTLTVRNTGDGPSTEQAVRMSLPDGVNATAVTVDGAPAGGGLQCTVPALEPGAAVTVVITLAVDADAQTGPARFDVDDDSATVELTVERPTPGPNPEPAPTAASNPAVRPDDAATDPSSATTTPLPTGP